MRPSPQIAIVRQMHWFWCWLCFRAYLALPIASTHKSIYGKFTLWLLGYAGFYAHSPRPASNSEAK